MTNLYCFIGLLFLITVSFSSAFADHIQVTIEAAQGSGAPGCEETAEGCYIPSTATVDVGGKVIFSNTDAAAHTFTAGTFSNPVNSIFDSGLLMAGSTHEWSPTEEGEVPYFCMVHPWMNGILIIQEKSSKEAHVGSFSIEGSGNLMEYEITGGKLLSVMPDLDSKSLIASIDATSDGLLILTIPRSVLDAKISGEDEAFFVLIDEEEVDFDEIATSSNRKLSVVFPETAKNIEIIGTETFASLSRAIEEKSPPKIQYNFNPNVVHVGDLVTFDSSGSTDDGVIVKAEWWFGDGNSKLGKKVLHKYSSQGEKHLHLIMIDDDNLQSEKSFTINVLESLSGSQHESISVKSADSSIIILAVTVTGIAGGAVLIILRLKKSSQTTKIQSTINSGFTSPKKDRSCNVCGTTIPEGKNVCPICGDTYSV